MLPIYLPIDLNFDQILLLYHIFSENNTEAVKMGVDVIAGPLVPTVIGEELPALRKIANSILGED